MEYFENWNKLNRADKNRLISVYGITAVGEPAEPTTVIEVEKVPQEEWDALIQKEVPKRKKKEKKVEKEVKEEKSVKKRKKVQKKSKKSKK